MGGKRMVRAVDAGISLAMILMASASSIHSDRKVPVERPDEVETSLAFNTPPALVGDCETIWVSAHDTYILPYIVRFRPSSGYSWVAPFRQSGAERGEGYYLTPVIYTANASKWEAHYFSATHYEHGNTTTCCCEYLGGASAGAPHVLTDWCRAAVSGGLEGLSLAEVCAPYMQEPCPSDNASASQQGIAPFIEVYATCGPQGDDRGAARAQTQVEGASLPLSGDLVGAAVGPFCAGAALAGLVSSVAVASVLSRLWFHARRAGSDDAGADGAYYYPLWASQPEVRYRDRLG